MADENAKRHQRARLLETIISVKESYLEKLTAEAVEYARMAVETGNPGYARKAIALRESAQWWSERIERNKAELMSLRNT